MSPSTFEEVWTRIEARAGEVFYTIKGLPFTYEMDHNAAVPDRTGYPVHLGCFRKAHEGGRVAGPSALHESIMGPSYVWAIMNDSRVSGWRS